MKYKMLVLDLDGTLTNSKKEISKATKEALVEIQRRGCKVVLASGRPTPGVMPFARQLQLDVYGGYALAFNGARIFDCKNKSVIYQKILPAYAVPEIYDAAIESHVGILTYTEDKIIAGTPIDEYMLKEKEICKVPLVEVENFKEYIDFPVNKCLLTAGGSYLAEVEKKLREKFHSLLSVYRSEPYFLEMLPKGIDKAYSLSKLLSSPGMTAKDMICCGDGFNDISMIEYAGLGIAMENAQKEVKNAADFITKSNDEEGILHVIREFLS